MKNNPDHLIRSIEPADLDELLVMMQEHADFEKATFTPAGKKERLYQALFEQPVKLNCYVVVIASQLVGYVSYMFDYSTWDAANFMYMDCLFLHPQTRGKGIGTQVLQMLSVIAAQNNCVNIQWQTPSFNEPAIRFYHKNKALSTQKERFTLKIS